MLFLLRASLRSLSGLLLAASTGFLFLHAHPSTKLADGKPLKMSEAEATAMIGQIIRNAESYLGTPYLYGGTSRHGIDCSALLMKSFRAAGLPLLRTSRQQATQGKHIRQNDLKRGDLLFFGKPSYISHVAMVTKVQGGRVYFIHASSRNRKVAYDQMDRYWYNKYVTARRMIEVSTASSSASPPASEEPELVFSFETSPRSCGCPKQDGFHQHGSSLSGKYPVASQRRLTYQDLKGMDQWELRIMRNEIFARKGYRFRTNAMIRYFQEQNWYRQLPKLSSNKMVRLSDIEQDNVAFIRNMELH
ncbi:MAG: NlpC/P60 family protein [Bacteroidota bacterium]